MLNDLRYALRMLVKAPGFTAVALLTLALGIGANTAIFTLVNATLLRLLPVGHPEQLALLTDPTANGTSFGSTGGNRPLLAYSEYELIRDNNQVFSGLLAAQSDTSRLQADWDKGGAGGETEPVRAKLVSNNYFDVLEVPAIRGRVFDPGAPLKIGAEPEAVITYAYWTSRFQRDPNVVGRTFRLNRQSFTVIGITPPGFAGESVGDAPDLFVPLAMTPEVMPGLDRLHDPDGVSRVMWLQVMGRLKPGVTLAQAQSNSNTIFLQAVQKQASAAGDANTRRNLMDQKLVLSPGGRGASSLRGQFGDALLALFALVGLVLLLAIINLASLLLARATARQKEMGVRLALGAGRSRIVRQLLLESVVLSVAGGALGLLLALWGDRILLQLVGAAGGQISLDLTPDLRVFGFVALVCIVTGILFGLAPALRMARLNLNATLQSSGRGGSGRTRHVLGGLIRGGLPLGKVLVIGQVALSIVLLVGASLFVRSLQKLSQAPLGFQPEQLAELGVDANVAGYKDAAAAALMHRLLDRMAAMPGVRAVGLSDNGILMGSDCGLPVQVAGYTAPNGKPTFGTRCDSIAGNYFQAAGIPLVLGRYLGPQDESGPVHVDINQTFATTVFKHGSPLGQQVHDMYPDDKGMVYTIVGVVGDSKHGNLAEKPVPRMYIPFFHSFPQSDMSSGVLLVRGAGGSGLAGLMRQAVRSVDPALLGGRIQTMPALIDQSLATQQLLAKLSGFFGVLALLMAAIGLYGIMSYGVARRTPEIGVRMALGASPGAVIGMVLGETALLAAFGVGIGLPASIGGAKVMASQIHLYDLRYYDPASLAAAVLILTGAALLAGLLPAQRASRVDPLTALRED